MLRVDDDATLAAGHLVEALQKAGVESCSTIAASDRVKFCRDADLIGFLTDHDRPKGVAAAALPSSRRGPLYPLRGVANRDRRPLIGLTTRTDQLVVCHSSTGTRRHKRPSASPATNPMRVIPSSLAIRCQLRGRGDPAPQPRSRPPPPLGDLDEILPETMSHHVAQWPRDRRGNRWPCPWRL